MAAVGMANLPPRHGTPVSLARFWQPRFWPLWVGIGLLRLTVLLPYPVLLRLGRGLGTLLRWTLRGRRHVAAMNLRLCFPEAGEQQRAIWLRDHFHSLGMAVFDLALALWAPSPRVARLVHVTGLEHITAARAGGTGVVLLTGHFPAAELAGRQLQARLGRMAALYRPMRNPLADELLRRGRAGSTEQLIPKDNMRQLIRALRQGYAIYFAPDQSHRRSYSALLPFFGEPAMTNTALTQIVRLSGAKVVPMLTRRRSDGTGYDALLLPAWEDFPGESPEADALRATQLLEDWIRGDPAQYYWIHRRFKGRPPPLPDPYA
jgi:KDO2-lipid IV(A) lauroyltransferase